MKTSLISWPHQLWYWTMNPSSLLPLTSSCPHKPTHHIQFTQDHLHPPIKRMKTSEATTAHLHPCQKPCHNQGPSWETNGSAIYKDWSPWSTTPYQGWQVEKSQPPSSTMILIKTPKKSSS